MSQICICVLMGLPASGKTSFVHKLKEVHNNDQIIYHICYDEILQFTRKEDELKLKRQQIVSFVEELVKKINDGLSERVSNMSDSNDQLHTSNQMKNINLYEDYQTKANHMIENLGKNIVNGRENDFISDNILIEKTSTCFSMDLDQSTKSWMNSTRKCYLIVKFWLSMDFFQISL
uniref:L-seryl-tRNA(Sec) kinase n=1 Tax=Cacopsylla melanoneura TaxID=428564 RepID=A0A8D9A8W9_9HEMI